MFLASLTQNRSRTTHARGNSRLHPLRALTLLMLPLLLLAPTALAQTAADTAKAIAPYVPDNTLLVIRCDVSKLDLGSIIDKYAGIEETAMRGASDQQKAESRAAIAKMKSDANSWRDTFLAAGGKEIFATIRFNPSDPPVTIIVPTTATSKPDAIIESIRTGLPTHASGHTKTLPAAAVTSNDEASLADLPLAAPTRGDDLARAFAACDPAAPIQAVFIPSDIIRKAFTELMPALPPEAGSIPMTTITDGAMWGAISLSFAPTGSIAIRLQSASPAAATAFVDALKLITDQAAKNADARQLPGGEAFLRLLTPKAQNDQVVLTLAGKDFDAVQGIVLPALGRARQSAREIKSATQVRALMQGCIIFASENKGQYPDNLQALIKPGYITEELLVNPSFPRRKPAYAYIKPDSKNEFVSTVVMVHETYDAWPSNGIWVGFCDGHVERVADETDFKKMLANKGNAK